MLPYSLQWNRGKEVVLSRRVISNPSLPAPMRGGAFSSGVEAPAGRTIYVSGQVSMDAEGNVVGEGDIKRQTETVLEHVKTVLEGAGGGMDDVVKVTVFITDMVLYDGSTRSGGGTSRSRTRRLRWSRSPPLSTPGSSSRSKPSR